MPVAHHKHLKLAVRDIDELRRLTVVHERRHCMRQLTLTIASIELPTPDWRGVFTPPRGTLSSRISWPSGRSGGAEIELQLCQDVFLESIVPSIVACFSPSHSRTSALSAEIGIAPFVAPQILAFLPDPVAKYVLTDNQNDALSALDTLVARWGVTPPGARFTNILSTALTGELGTAVRFRSPSVDVRLHNPLGRVGERVPSSPEATLSIHEGTLHLTSGQKVIHPPISSATPLPRSAVISLRPYLGLNASALHDPDRAEDRAQLASRLTELAATGVLLHSVALPRTLAQVAPTIEPTSWAHALPSELVARRVGSVSQHRAAIRGGSGIVHLDAAQVAAGQPHSLPHVTAILVTNRPGLVDRSLRALAAQTYPHLDAVVAVHGFPMPPVAEELRHLVTESVSIPAHHDLGTALGIATRYAQGDLVTKFDDDDYYSPEHIWDLVLARTYSGAEVVGKHPEYTHISRYDITVQRAFTGGAYGEAVAGGTLMISKADLYELGGWRPVPRSVDRALFQRVLRAGGLVYATHGLGFVYARNGSGHTWASTDSQFLRGVVQQWAGLEPRLLG